MDFRSLFGKHVKFVLIKADFLFLFFLNLLGEFWFVRSRHATFVVFVLCSLFFLSQFCDGEEFWLLAMEVCFRFWLQILILKFVFAKYINLVWSKIKCEFLLILFVFFFNCCEWKMSSFISYFCLWLKFLFGVMFLFVQFVLKSR